MPFFLGIPIIAGISAAITTKTTAAVTIAAGTAAGFAYGEQIRAYFDSEPFQTLITDGAEAAAAQYIGTRTGLILNDNDPFSKASFNAAISQKMGINFTDISDRDQVMIDLGRAVSDLINLQTGMTLPAFQLNNPVQIKQAFQDEIATQAVNALAGQLSVLDDATLAIIKSAALADAYGQPPPSILPTKLQLQRRAASRRYYDREYRAGNRRVWIQKAAPPSPPLE